MKLYLVCYDVSNDKGRRLVEKVLKGYGIRHQYSVFICELDLQRFKELQKTLKQTIKDSPKLYLKNVDSILMLPICEQCYKKTVTMLKEVNGRPTVII